MTDQDTTVSRVLVNSSFVKSENHADTESWRLELLAGEEPFRPTEPGHAPPIPHNQMIYSLAGRREQFVDLARMILFELEPPPDRILDTLLRIEKLLEKQSSLKSS